MKKVILSLIVVIIIVMASSTLASFSSESSIVSGGINSGDDLCWDINGFYTMTKNIEVVKNQKYTLDFVFDGGKPGADYSLYFDVFYNNKPYDGKTIVPLNAKLIKTDKDGTATTKQGSSLCLNDWDFPNVPIKLDFDEGQKNYYKLEIEFADQSQILPTIFKGVKINLQGVVQNKAAVYRASDILYQVNYAKQSLEAMTEAERKAEFGYGYINNEMIRTHVKNLNLYTFPKAYTKEGWFYIQPYIPQVVLADGQKGLDCSQTTIFGKIDQDNGWFTKYVYDIESTTWYYLAGGMSLAGRNWSEVRALIFADGSKWTPVVF